MRTQNDGPFRIRNIQQLIWLCWRGQGFFTPATRRKHAGVFMIFVNYAGYFFPELSVVHEYAGHANTIYS